MKKKVQTLEDGLKILDLPSPFFEAQKSGSEDFTGIWILALYYGPKSNRCFATTYSIWDAGKGRCVGEKTQEITASDLIKFAERVGANLPDNFIEQQTIVIE